MEAAVGRLAASLAEVDGLILKGRSPSCGLNDVRIFASAWADDPFDDRGRGMFAAGMLQHFPHLAVEDEAGLAEPTRRDHFLTRVFTTARFRAVRLEGTPNALVRFHVENRLLLLAYDPRRLGLMDQVVATLDVGPLAPSLETYVQHLQAVLARPACHGDTPTR